MVRKRGSLPTENAYIHGHDSLSVALSVKLTAIYRYQTNNDGDPRVSDMGHAAYNNATGLQVRLHVDET